MPDTIFPGFIHEPDGDGSGDSVEVKSVVLEFSDSVAPGTAINIQTGVYAGGGPATVTGDTITLPATGAAFKAAAGLEIMFNGLDLIKGSSGGDELANWVSTTQISLDHRIFAGNCLKIRQTEIT